MHGKRVSRARINAHGNDRPQTKTTNKAVNYTAVQAQVALRGALTTINGSSAGITADSDAEPRASKCRLSVLPAYCRRIASVTTDVRRGTASVQRTLGAESRRETPPCARTAGLPAKTIQ